MTIYKIHNDGGFAEVHPDLKNISIKSPDRQIITSAIREFSSYNGGWVNLEGIIEENSKPIPAITRLNGPDLVLAPAAYEYMHEELSEYGEFYDIHLKGESFHLFRCLNRIENIDKANSSLNEFDEIVTLGFLPEDIKGHLIWTTSFDGGEGLYCSKKFKALVNEKSFSGVEFDVDLASLSIN